MNDLPEKQNAAAAGDVAPGTFAFDPAGLPGDGLTFAILSQPSEGWAINNHDGSFFFDPVMDFRNLGVGESRRVKFTYQASDGQGATQTATTTLVVTGRSDAPPMVEFSGVVAGAEPALAPRPAPPREPGFITDTPEDTAVPEESLPEATADMADDLGAIELVDIEPPVETAPETPLDQAPDAWPGGMAVEEQQRRVENALVEDVPDHSVETAAFDPPRPLAQDLADEPAAQDPVVDLPAGGDVAFAETGFLEAEAPSDLAEVLISDPAPVESVADGLEMAPAPDPFFGESEEAATDWAADPVLAEPAQPPADLSAAETLAPSEMADSPDPIGVDGYQSDQLPVSSAGEAAMESMAAPARHEPVPDLAPESSVDNAFGGMAGTEPMTSFMAEPAPLAMDVATQDDAVGWGGDGPKGFAYADVAASGQIAYRILSQPDEGRVEDRGDGSFTFEPGPPLLDMAIGEMCQVDFTYQVEIDGHDTACIKATVTVTGTGDGPEPDAVSFGPGEPTDASDSASATADFAPAPVVTDTGPELAEMPLPVGPANLETTPETLEAGFEEPAAPLTLGAADLDTSPETPEAGFEEPAAPLPLGAADDRREAEPMVLAPVGDGELSDEMPPGTEPWPTLDPVTEASLRKTHDEGLGGSVPFERPSPVAELAAEHGTDVPDSIPAFLAGEPEAKAVDSPGLEDSPLAEQTALDASDAIGDEAPAKELNDPEEPRFLDDMPLAGLATAEADDGAAAPTAFVPETEDTLGTEIDAMPVEFDPAFDPLAAAPEVSEETDAIEDDVAAAPTTEEAVAFFEDGAADFSSSEQESGDGDLAPLDAQDGALDEPPAAGSGGAIDLAAAYLKAQGADLSALVAKVPPATENPVDLESGPGFAGKAPQLFDDESPFESTPEQPLSAAEPALAAPGEIAPGGQSGTDLLPGMTAAEVLRSVVGGNESDAEDASGELEDGERSDTLHVDGVNGGPGVGGWELELTEGGIVETHSEHLLLSDGAAGAIVLDGNVGRIKFEGIERIVW